jgi:hypothetical protein
VAKPAFLLPTCVTSAAYTTSRMGLNTDSVILLSQDANGSFLGYAPKTGGMYTTVAAQGPSAAIAASDQTIYLGNPYGPHIDAFGLPMLMVGPNACIDGCGDGTVVDLALDTTLDHAFWATTKGEVVFAPFPPPTANGTLLGTVMGTPQRIARDASFVYVTTQMPGAVWAVPIAGGMPIALARGENDPFGIAVDGSRVYWTCGDGTIRAVPLPPS